MATAADSQIEQRFNAAVNVIRGLPKHGSYQPSNDLMLRFYSYFKQATLGPCTQQRPAFWDVVNKVKWDTYNSLGNMPRERAMELYVEELKKIIETMSYTDNVAEFMGSITELNSVDLGDLEAVAPEAIKQVKSRPNSPFGSSRGASPIRRPDNNGSVGIDNLISNGGVLAASYEEDETYNGNSSTADYSDDEYIDTVEDDTILLHDPMLHSRFIRPSTNRRADLHDERPVSPSNNNNGLTNGHQYNHSSQTNKSHSYNQLQTHQQQPVHQHQANYSANVEPALNQLLRCVESMRVDLQQINNRITIVERSLGDVKQCQLLMQQQKQQQLDDPRNKHRKKIAGFVPQWWPFAGISPTWMAVLILWPLVARRLMAAMERRRR